MPHTTEQGKDWGRVLLWCFLVIGIVLVLAGIAVPQTLSTSLPKAELLTGVFLIIGVVISLVISS